MITREPTLHDRLSQDYVKLKTSIAPERMQTTTFIPLLCKFYATPPAFVFKVENNTTEIRQIAASPGVKVIGVQINLMLNLR